jgi:hypothetical protein
MADGFIVRRGGKSVNQAATPSINFVSKTDESITVTFTNNDAETATIVYRIDSLTTEGESISLASNATSANVTFAGLDDDTEYTIFATANVVGKVKSEPASTNITTDVRIFTAATGGTTEEYNLDGKRYRSHTFTSDGDFIVTTAGDGDRNKVDVLVIAGGGGGGNVIGGGGGAGGYQTTIAPTPGNTTPVTKPTVTVATHSVVVGSGGNGLTGNDRAESGTNSSVLNIIATGGGGGGSGQNDTTNSNGGTGGSGGGAVYPTRTGGTGTSGQGTNGGDGSGNDSAGGGGGASQAGQNAQTSAGGKGGDGLANLLRTGSNETRAGGGGGGARSGSSRVGGNGGSGGGGNGTATSSAGGNGTVNTGSGAGGAGFDGTNVASGNGGSGIVIIRYEIAPTV